jgi:lipopolysaccharide transport system permease protein
VIAELRELTEYGNLFRTFLRRDVSSRYKGSALGVLWSLLNPLAQLATYSFVFSYVLRIKNVDNYPVFFVAGFVPWFFFSSALILGTGTLVQHRALIEKVYFPRVVLPLSMTAANLINMLIALLVAFPYIWWTQGIDLVALTTLVPVTAALFLFSAGLAILLSVVMVYFRDTEFLVGIGLNVWFYATPIVYPLANVPHRLQPWMGRNPMTLFANAYRQVLLDGNPVSFRGMAVLAGIGVATFLVCYAIFLRLEGRIAEEL